MSPGDINTINAMTQNQLNAFFIINSNGGKTIDELLLSSNIDLTNNLSSLVNDYNICSGPVDSTGTLTKQNNLNMCKPYLKTSTDAYNACYNDLQGQITQTGVCGSLISGEKTYFK
jgi:hypothetical protein